MKAMTAGLVSPVFAGRKAELTLLAGAFEDAAGGTPRTVLTGAEAGGGKSRLVTEFTATVGDRAMVLAGGCVELSSGGLPYAPFTAALRQLVRTRGAAEVAGLLPGQAAGELGVLLPDFGTPPAGADPGTARARLFEVLLTLLEALAEQQPVVLVVEDVHWADRSTCDLLSFLVRNIQRARVLLVVTFRSDELNRNDMLRPLLAGLARAERVSRLELARLSRAQAAMQLEGILGRPPDAALISEVYQRGGGVPLLTEALVSSDGTVSAELPTSVRDLLLAAVAVLPERTQQALRISAAGGARLSPSRRRTRSCVPRSPRQRPGTGKARPSGWAARPIWLAVSARAFCSSRSARWPGGPASTWPPCRGSESSPEGPRRSGSPSANSKCCAWWLPAAATAISPPSSSSRPRRPACTCPTSSASSASARVARPPRRPTASTFWTAANRRTLRSAISLTEE